MTFEQKGLVKKCTFENSDQDPYIIMILCANSFVSRVKILKTIFFENLENRVFSENIVFFENVGSIKSTLILEIGSKDPGNEEISSSRYDQIFLFFSTPSSHKVIDLQNFGKNTLFFFFWENSFFVLPHDENQ